MSTQKEIIFQHTTGKSIFIDDIPVPAGMLHGKVYYSTMAHALIKSFSIEKALEVDGIHAIISFKDIPGKNRFGAIIKDEYFLANAKVEFIGQAIFLIAAESVDIADKAAALIQIEYEELSVVIEIEDAIYKSSLLYPETVIMRGDVDNSFLSCSNIFEGDFKTGAQEHWYLETQAALVIPDEEDKLNIFSSSQHPSEIQEFISGALDLPSHKIEVEVKRMGGAFGGKETQAGQIAVWASLLAYKTGRPVKIVLSRDDDQKITGKRHPFLFNYKVGFDNSGIIKCLDVILNANGGAANDLSKAIMERAMFHANNAYFIENIRIIGRIWKSNIPPNTAFRGFGAPQSMAAMENIIDRIARFLFMDPAVIRKNNFYNDVNNITPYGQIVKNNKLNILYDKLIESSEYFERRNEINTFHTKNRFVKRGLALSPVKFGISFTTNFLNQAGALVHIYKDGSVLVNHGGTEMGQGLHAKIKIIASEELGISPDKIVIASTNTSKVPNTSATAASSGTDLNGMAVKDALTKLKDRLIKTAAEFLMKQSGKTEDEKEMYFYQNNIYSGHSCKLFVSFTDVVGMAYRQRVSLSATGFYKTPEIYYDPEKGQGNPFFYYSFGMAVSEVEIDILTGSHTILRTDILHDAGNSINEDIDIGQITGGFIQGVGWCTMEICKWDKKGNLLNHSPDTYKIPGVNDIPESFNINLLKGHHNENTIRNSKAVGEPPFMLAISVWLCPAFKSEEIPD